MEGSPGFLRAIYQLPCLPARPSLHVYKQVAGVDYWRLRYLVRNPEGGESLRECICVGPLTANEKLLLDEEIARLWPPDETRPRQDGIERLELKRWGMRELSRLTAEDIGGDFRGYSLVIPDPSLAKASPQILESLRECLVGVRALNAELAAEHLGMTAMELQGFAPVSPRRIARRGSKMNALKSATKKTDRSIERVDELMGRISEGGLR